jgi:FkbM family methyltransferase
VRKQMYSVVSRALSRFGLRLVPSRSLPLGDVQAFCEGLRDRGLVPRHVFDVGANRGDWSRAAREVFPDADYTLIEPQIEMRPSLERFCAETKHARWINAGAGAEQGEMKITVFPDTVSSSFAITDAQAREWGLEQRAVPIVTLDAVAAELGAVPEMVKLDVEGFEQEVLKGSASLLGKTEIFLLEMALLRPYAGSMPFSESVAHMAEIGYRPYDFTSFQHRPYDGALAICELAFAREDGLLRSHLDWR